MEQLVILLIIGAISLVNWLIRKSAEMREQKKQARREQGLDPADSDTSEIPAFQEVQKPAAAPETADESMRRLMEALGLPTESEPPALPRPVVEAPPPIPKIASAPPLTPRVSKNSAAKDRRLLREAREIKPQRPRLAAKLATSQGLRDAVVLAEILGPPKGLRGSGN